MLIPSYKKNQKRTNFYERDAYINVFNEELNNVKKDNINLLMYYGVGGIGKTTLLKYLYENHTNNNIKVFINLEEYNNQLNFYSKLILELHKSNIKLFNFKIAFAIYWNKLNPNLAMKENEAFKGEWETIIPIIDEIGFGVGSIFKALYEYKDEFKNKFLNNYKNELEELENMNFQEIARLLPKFLNYDLTLNMKNRDEKIIFFLDTHEVLFENSKKGVVHKLNCDNFLRDFVLSTYELNTLFVMAGREKLIWNKDETEWNDYINHVELDSLSKEASINYLKDNGIKEENIISLIIDYTDCVPFYLNLELNLYLKLENPSINDFNGSKTKQDIFNRFMLYADSNELQLLKVLAFAKKFNLDLFEAIIKEFNIPVSILVFDDLVSNSYVTEIDEENFALHNLMKLSIKDSVKDVLKNKINKFLFDFYEDNILEQIHYAFEFKTLSEIYQFIQDKINNTDLKNNTLLIKRVYELIFYKYYSEMIDLINKEDYNEEVNAYFLFYVDLGSLYLKTNNKIDFNDLNTNSFYNIKLNKYLINMKNYLFLQYILSGPNKYKNTLEFIDKIDINLFPLNYKINFKIDLANFYRQNKKYKKAEITFDELETLFEDMTNKQKFQFYMKKGFLYKNYQDYEQSIEFFNKAKLFIDDKDSEAKLYRALGEVYILNNKHSIAIEEMNKAIALFDKLYGILNEESIICFKILIRNKILIENPYFKIFNLFKIENKNIEVASINNVNKIIDIIKKEDDKLIIENIYKITTKSLYELNIHINLDELEELVSLKLDNRINICLCSFMYYQKFDLDKAFDNIHEAYKISKSFNLLKLISYNYDSSIFFKYFEEDYNSLKTTMKFDILLNLEDYKKIVELFIDSNNIGYSHTLLQVDGEFLIEHIDSLENILKKNQENSSLLDIFYTKVLNYYQTKDNSDVQIEKYLIKQMKIREDLNLKNLYKGYIFLAKFYKKVNKMDLYEFYRNKLIINLEQTEDKVVVEGIRNRYKLEFNL